MSDAELDADFWLNLWQDVNTVDLGECLGLLIFNGYHVTLDPPRPDRAPRLFLRHERWGMDEVELYVTDVDLVADLTAAIQEGEGWVTDVELGILMAKYNP